MTIDLFYCALLHLFLSSSIFIADKEIYLIIYGVVEKCIIEKAQYSVFITRLYEKHRVHGRLEATRVYRAYNTDIFDGTLIKYVSS